MPSEFQIRNRSQRTLTAPSGRPVSARACAAADAAGQMRAGQPLPPSGGSPGRPGNKRAAAITEPAKVSVAELIIGLAQLGSLIWFSILSAASRSRRCSCEPAPADQSRTGQPPGSERPTRRPADPPPVWSSRRRVSLLQIFILSNANDHLLLALSPPRPN